MNFVRAVAALAVVTPLFAQYGGPAILARGQSPGATAPSVIDFRPYLSVSGTYDAGLNGVSVNPDGSPVNDATYGVSVGFGISGTHAWKHTRVGLNWSSGFSHYAKSFYDGIDSQSLGLSISHQLSRHALLTLGTSSVLYGSNHATPTLPPTLEFDPNTTNLPTNDFFDNRTFSISQSASVTIQKSTRISYSLGGTGFLTRRRSSSLYGSLGQTAYGDIMYRMSRRGTIGVVYEFTHYSFTGIAGNTYAHSVAGSYSRVISRSVQFSAFAGVARYENLFVQVVPIDPAIAAIIGISSAERIVYLKSLTPNFGARISKVVPRGTVFASASHSINPGNGLFLTSTATDVSTGYNYTGVRHWALSAGAAYNTSSSLGNVVGQYGSYGFSASASRQIARLTHGVFSFNARKYDSGDFSNYNKWAYGVSLGLSFSPGDIPVRLW